MADIPKIRRRTFLGSLIGSSSVLLLAACAGPAPSASAPASGTQAGGTLNILMASEPVTMDPQFAPGTAEDVISVNIMEGLFTTGENLAVVPKLAESYSQIDENTWEFKLRQGIKFHNGEPFDSTAVKATYDRSQDQSLKIRNTWAADVNIDHIDAVDPLTVRFYTKTPTPHMLARIANDHYMYPPQFLKDTDPKDLARKAIGTGPYMFKDWTSGDRITLEANPNYWGAQKPSIKARSRT
jgi:peptide/nickel transport system substrate-binding protein